MKKKKSIFKEIAEQEEQEELKEKDELAFAEQIEIDLLSKSITLPQVKEICKKYLLLPDDTIIDVILAVCCSIQFSGDPLWVFLQGASAGGKTELLRACISERNIHKDSLTSKTLVSGLRKGGIDPSLFAIINNKTLILKDFTNIFSMRKEDAQVIYSQFRNAYDGYYDPGSGGEAGHPHYETHFAMLAGTTGVLQHYWALRQQLGERYLIYAFPENKPMSLANRVEANKEIMQEMRRELRLNFGAFIKKFQDDISRATYTEALGTKIKYLSIFVTRARSYVHRNKFSREIDCPPEIEECSRLLLQLFLFLDVLCLIREKKEVTELEYSLIYKIATDSMPPARFKVINFLSEDLDNFWITSLVAERLHLPTESAKVILEDLNALKIVERTGINPLEWRLNPDFNEYLLNSKPESY